MFSNSFADPTAGQGADEAGAGPDGHGGDEQDGGLDVQAQVAAEPRQGEGGRARRRREGARGGRGEEEAQGGREQSGAVNILRESNVESSYSGCWLTEFNTQK